MRENGRAYRGEEESREPQAELSNSGRTPCYKPHRRAAGRVPELQPALDFGGRSGYRGAGIYL
jgi:hypothetical protein